MTGNTNPVSPYEGMTAVLYARVSTDDKGQTNETQLRLMRQWCERNGVRIIAEFEDEESGTSVYRDEFSKMMLRIMMPPYDVNILLAYDQSRITRDKKLEDIMTVLEPSGCVIRFVSMDLDPESFEGDIINAVIQRVDKRENDVRREKTRQGMETRRNEGEHGIHLGRPARVIFAEDKETAPEGRYVKGYTIVVSEPQIYGFAEKGYSLNFVATRILEIDPHSLEWEMKPRDPSRPKCRNRGTKDRWKVYMEIYRRATGTDKGCTEQRVGNPSDSDVQRVVG
ncbi:MAG: hypothetical protein A3205_05835 [Methanomassiliicoccales archaeon Mx-03]|nr:MAG: hypothetical protein A3205_05835 [Methanomassiliicoccales archaeon Mx-03]